MASDKLIQNLRGQHRTSPSVPSGPAARSALRLTLAIGVAGAGLGVCGAGPAVADPVSLELGYTCSVPVVRERSGTVKIDSDVPKSTPVGKPTSEFVIRASVPVNAADTRGLRRAGIKTIKGTVDAKFRVRAPEGDTNLNVPFQVATANVPASGPFLVKATAAAPKRTFSRPGKAKITVGDLVMHVTASGVLTVKLDVPCRLGAGQNNVVASFDITGTGTGTGAGTGTGTGPGTTTGPAPSETAGAGTSGTTGSQNPSEVAKAGAPKEGSAADSGDLATAGSQGTTRLIPLAAGAVVLGTISVAAVVRFRSRGR
ncbi:DUF6801 domain-containing protein [Streptomyces aurantiacus]|nr:DUF6801 domain-containing protein [Streptomyces aurantiacus]